jgi:hypothetical protein
MTAGLRNLLGTMLICAMALSVTGALPLLERDEAGCCCKDHSQECLCRACTHARGLASSKSLLETCTPQAASAVPVTHAVVVVTADARLPLPPLRLRVDSAPRQPPPDPVPEVPTPPPLALS